MSIICKMFGHKTSGNKYDGSEYMSVNNIICDGMGTNHATVHAECDRCKENFRVGMIHIPSQFQKINKLKNKNI